MCMVGPCHAPSSASPESSASTCEGGFPRSIPRLPPAAANGNPSRFPYLPFSRVPLSPLTGRVPMSEARLPRGSVPAGAAHRMNFRPERRTAGKGARCAAKRILASEHRCGVPRTSMGGAGGNTFLLVSLERCVRTAGPMTAKEQTRRLITLIFAGRNRMLMIRRELPRTSGAGWVRRPFRIEGKEGSLFVVPSLSSALLS